MMRKFTLLYLLFLPAFLFAKENPDHFVRSKDGFYFIVHHVRSQENLFQIAKLYNLKPAVLAKFNDLTYSAALSVNEIIDIPLTETNYFKLANLGEENGFIRIYYRLEEEQNVDYLCDQFQLPSESFCSWNKVQPNATLKTGTHVMIGWLMYQREAGALSTTSPKEEKTESATFTTTTTITENKTAAKKMAKGEEPTLANSAEKAWDKLNSSKKDNKQGTVTKQSPPPSSQSNPTPKPLPTVKFQPTQTPPPTATSTSKGHASTHPTFKEDTRDFWNKIKSKFQRKPKEESIAQASPIRKDPNRQPGPKARPQTDKEKISLKERWNRLVNGPEPTSKPHTQAPTSTKTLVTQNNQTPAPKTNPPLQKSTTPVQKTITPKQNTPSKNTELAKKPTLKERWNRLVNGPEPNKPARTSTTTSSAKPGATAKVTTINKSEAPKENNTKPISPKPTLKERWNRLVNGPETAKPAAKSTTTTAVNTKPIAPKPSNTLATKTNPPVNANNKPVVTNKTTPVKTNTEAPKTNKEKKSLKDRWNHLVNGEAPVRNKPTPVVKKTTSNVSVDTKKTEKVIDKKSSTNTVTKNSTSNTSKQTETKTNAVEKTAENIAPKETVIEKETTIHSEVKTLSLTNVKTVKAAYFFSGPSGGKFYAVTNLVTKGAIIKLTNPANGRSIMAEVIGNLSPIDLNKGLLLKVSDNAKLALGQKNTLFSIKVNY